MAASIVAEDVRRLLHKKGLRLTPQRLLILQALQEAKTHLDAEELYRILKERDRRISLATVYRNLALLCEVGLVEQRFFAGSQQRVYYEPHGSEHYHFTCRKCGKVIEFESDLIPQVERALEDKHGVRVERVCVYFDGLCSECLAQEEDSMPERVTLDELRPGQKAIVVRVGGDGALRRRLMEMGLVTGAEIEEVRVAPLGDPVEFTVKGNNLSLRRSEARLIEVEITSSDHIPEGE